MLSLAIHKLNKNLCWKRLLPVCLSRCCGQTGLLNEDGEDDFDAILAEMENEISMADLMCELGYGCTANVAQCKEMLSLFLPLSCATVAKILATISRTYADLDDSQNGFATFRSALGGNIVADLPSLSSWNVDVLVDSINQLVSSIVVLF